MVLLTICYFKMSSLWNKQSERFYGIRAHKQRVWREEIHVLFTHHLPTFCTYMFSMFVDGSCFWMVFLVLLFWCCSPDVTLSSLFCCCLFALLFICFLFLFFPCCFSLVFLLLWIQTNEHGFCLTALARTVDFGKTENSLYLTKEKISMW